MSFFDGIASFQIQKMMATLKSWTPMTANMNWRRRVTRTMLPMVLTATMTHWTTCLSPLARLMALRGRRTRRTLRIFTTEIAPELQRVHQMGLAHVILDWTPLDIDNPQWDRFG